MNEIKLAQLKELVEAVGASENKDTALGKANLLLRWRAILNPKNANLPSNPETYKQFEADLLEAYPWANSKSEFKQQLAHFKTTIAQIKKADPTNAFADENQAWIDDTLNLVLGYNAKDTSFYLPALAERQAQANGILENQGIINLYNEVNPKLVEIKGWITKINQKQESIFYDKDLINDASAWLQTSDKTLARWLEYPEKAQQNLESIQANILHAEGYYHKVEAMHENIYTLAGISENVAKIKADIKKLNARLKTTGDTLARGFVKGYVDIKKENAAKFSAITKRLNIVTGFLNKKIKESNAETTGKFYELQVQVAYLQKEFKELLKSQVTKLLARARENKAALATLNATTLTTDDLDTLYEDLEELLEEEFAAANTKIDGVIAELTNAQTRIEEVVQSNTQIITDEIENFNTTIATSATALAGIETKIDALTTKLDDVAKDTKALIRVTNDTSSTVTTMEAVSITTLVIVAGGTLAKAGSQIRKVMKDGGFKKLKADLKNLTSKNKKK